MSIDIKHIKEEIKKELNDLCENSESIYEQESKEIVMNIKESIDVLQAEIDRLKKYTIEPDVLKFLHGCGKLNDVWFTDHNYFWRKYLPKPPEGES